MSGQTIEEKISYANAYLDRENIFNSISFKQQRVDRICRYKSIVGIIRNNTEKKDEYIKALTEDMEILKLHFLLVCYERRYKSTQELYDLLHQIIKCGNMLDALEGEPKQNLQDLLVLDKPQYQYNRHRDMQWMTYLNDKRLTALWFRLMMPDLLDIGHATDPDLKLELPNEIAGELSFILYGARLTYEMAHIGNISTLTLTPEDREKLRQHNAHPFFRHIGENKYQLINDSVWGVDNFLEWLNKQDPTLLGGYGNYIGIALFSMDFILQLYSFKEESERYEKKLEAIKNASQSDDEDENQALLSAEDKNKALLSEEDKNKALLEEELSWKYKERNMVQTSLYLLTLVVGFSMFCMCPPAIVASLLLVGSTLIYNVSKRNLKVREAQERMTLLSTLIRNDKAKVDRSSDEKSLETKMLKIDIVANVAEYKNQQMILKQQERAVKITATLNILLPALSFACLCLLPTGVGFGALVGVIVVVLALHYMYKKTCDKILEEKYLKIDSNTDFKTDFEKTKWKDIDQKYELLMKEEMPGLLSPKTDSKN
jgi:hypothetical protein